MKFVVFAAAFLLVLVSARPKKTLDSEEGTYDFGHLKSLDSNEGIGMGGLKAEPAKSLDNLEGTDFGLKAEPAGSLDSNEGEGMGGLKKRNTIV